MEADNDSPTAIDPNIIPPGNYNIPMIVLWQQTGLGLTRNWLAYTFGVEEPLDDIAGWIGVKNPDPAAISTSKPKSSK